MEFLQNYWYIILLFGAAIVFGLVFNVINRNRMKNNNGNFLQEHPDAGKVYLTSRASITSEAVMVSSVNGQPPQYFQEGTKTGFYALPGRNTLLVTYTYTRPGVLYKNVSKSTGEVEQVLEIEPYKSYQLGFDRENEVFTFGEYTAEAVGA